MNIHKTDQVNYLNIGLMLVSFMAAFVLPFELFLFAYAILGPLHYLTEISWLHDRKYFIQSRFDALYLVVLCVLLTIGMIYSKSPVSGWAGSLMFVGFLFPLALLLIRNMLLKLTIFLALFFIAAWLGIHKIVPIQLFLLVFLPTLVHVFAFTGLFILLGSVKQKSTSGYISLLVFVCCGIGFFLLKDNQFHFLTSKGSVMYEPYQVMNMAMLHLLGEPGFRTKETIFHSPAGLTVMRFIAFAYLYHYLNWFSKTQVIKWHEVSKTRIAFVLVGWLISVSIYLYDYFTGFLALYFLSILHVFLEFPLNHKTLFELVKVIFSGEKKTTA